MSNPAIARLQNRDRQKSDLTAAIEFTEYRLQMKAEEAEGKEESSLYDEENGQNAGMLVAVASTQVLLISEDARVRVRRLVSSQPTPHTA